MFLLLRFSLFMTMPIEMLINIFIISKEYNLLLSLTLCLRNKTKESNRILILVLKLKRFKLLQCEEYIT